MYPNFLNTITRFPSVLDRPLPVGVLWTDTSPEWFAKVIFLFKKNASNFQRKHFYLMSC